MKAVAATLLSLVLVGVQARRKAGPNGNPQMEIQIDDNDKSRSCTAYLIDGEAICDDPFSSGRVLDVKYYEGLKDDQNNTYGKIPSFGAYYQSAGPPGFDTVLVGGIGEGETGYGYIKADLKSSAEGWFHRLLAYPVKACGHQDTFLVCFGTQAGRDLTRDLLYDCRFAMNVTEGGYEFRDHRLVIRNNTDNQCTNPTTGESAPYIVTVTGRADPSSYVSTCMFEETCDDPGFEGSSYYYTLYNVDVGLDPSLMPIDISVNTTTCAAPCANGKNCQLTGCGGGSAWRPAVDKRGRSLRLHN